VKLNHIYNSDCLDAIKKFKDNSIDLVITSPPYAGKRGNDYDTIKESDYVEWFLPRSAELLRVLKPSGSFILNIKEPAINGERSTYIIELILSMKKQGWLWTEEYIWRKTTSFPGKWPNRFRDGWERCLHFTKQKQFKMNQDAVMVPIGDWTKTRFMKNKGTKKKKLLELAEDDRIRRTSESKSGLARQVANWIDRDFVFPDNVLEFAPVVNNKKQHSAAFPDALPEWFIKLFSNKGDVVLDPFIGSGTTAMMAKQLGRHYIGIEKQKKYYRLAKQNISGTNLKKKISKAIKREHAKSRRKVKVSVTTKN